MSKVNPGIRPIALVLLLLTSYAATAEESHDECAAVEERFLAAEDELVAHQDQEWLDLDERMQNASGEEVHEAERDLERHQDDEWRAFEDEWDARLQEACHAPANDEPYHDGDVGDECREAEEGLRAAEDELDASHQAKWDTLDDARRAAERGLDDSRMAEWNELDEEWRAAERDLNDHQEAEWDELGERMANATEEEWRAAERELMDHQETEWQEQDEERRAAERDLEDRYETKWQELDEERRAAERELDDRHEAEWHELHGTWFPRIEEACNQPAEGSYDDDPYHGNDPYPGEHIREECRALEEEMRAAEDELVAHQDAEWRGIEDRMRTASERELQQAAHELERHQQDEWYGFEHEWRERIDTACRPEARSNDGAHHDDRGREDPHRGDVACRPVDGDPTTMVCKPPRDCVDRLYETPECTPPPECEDNGDGTFNCRMPDGGAMPGPEHPRDEPRRASQADPQEEHRSAELDAVRDEIHTILEDALASFRSKIQELRATYQEGKQGLEARYDQGKEELRTQYQACLAAEAGDERVERLQAELACKQEARHELRQLRAELLVERDILREDLLAEAESGQFRTCASVEERIHGVLLDAGFYNVDLGQVLAPSDLALCSGLLLDLGSQGTTTSAPGRIDDRARTEGR